MKKVTILLSAFLMASCLHVAVASNPVAEKNAKDELAMKDVYDFLKKCGTYFIATAEGDQPRVRPFGTVGLFENKLYIQTSKQKRVSKQLKANPKVEICALNQAEGKWIRVAATLVNDDRVAAKQAMLKEYPSLANTYSATDDKTQVLYLKDATATFSSFTEEDKVVKF